MQWLGLVLLAIAVEAGPAMAASDQGALNVAGLRFSVFDPFMLARCKVPHRSQDRVWSC